jgi:Cys-tRNA(Pro)/Cys-tRNA(Cys) deacylase
MRVLEAKGISYRAVQYDSTGDFHSGEEAAALVGATPESVFKTLVVIGEDSPGGKPLMVMVPVLQQVDLKLLAQELGAKKLRMATQREAERLTGMQAGGISALAVQAQRFVILIDESAGRLSKAHVSAGSRGVDLELAVVDLVAATGARFVRATGPVSRSEI